MTIHHPSKQPAGLMRRLQAPVVAACLAIGALAAPHSAFAVTPVAWKTTNYAIAPGNVPLRQVLTDLERTLGISVELTNSVQGSVSSTGEASTVEAFLSKLAATHNLSWFVFRNRLYVSRESDSQEAYVPMPSAQAGELRSYLNGLKLFEEKFGWVQTPSRSEVIVIGPPAYIRLVRQYAGSMARLKPAPNTVVEPMQTMTFKLRHASAADTPGLDGLSAPGVKTLLSRIHGARDSSLMSGIGRGLSNPRDMAEMTRQRMERSQAARDSTSPASDVGASGPANSISRWDGTAAAVTSDDDGLPIFAATPLQRSQPLTRLGPYAADSQAVTTARQGTDESPTIEADERLNLIIVRDKASKRAEYARLIGELDVPTSQLVLDATVIEVDTQMLQVVFNAFANLPRQGTGGSTLLVPRPVADSLHQALRVAKRCDPDAAVVSQSVVFKEGGRFTLGFSDDLRYPENSTPFWYALLSQVAALPKEPVDRVRKIGLRVSGLARLVPDRRVALTMDLTEGRDSPNLGDRTIAQRATETSLAIELSEDEVMLLSEGLAWSGSEMKASRSRMVMLSARRWTRDHAATRVADGAAATATVPVQLLASCSGIVAQAR
jgi:hypothetical protein